MLARVWEWIRPKKPRPIQSELAAVERERLKRKGEMLEDKARFTQKTAEHFRDAGMNGRAQRLEGEAATTQTRARAVRSKEAALIDGMFGRRR